MSLLQDVPQRLLPDIRETAADARLTPLLYAATLFASALLLFSIQPMFAKMVLPKLGGAPAVWSVAMVFFQTMLLAGYAYAHWLSALLPPRRAAVVHVALIAVTTLALPIAIAPDWGAPPTEAAALWLFGLFAVSIGLPFFTLSASAPLLQSWFAASRHRQAGNPYVLYAASNLGSFAALFAYPAVIEPLLSLHTQTAAWSIGFAALALLMVMVALRLGRDAPAPARHADAAPVPAPSLAERARWVALSAVPSGLVIAVTSHLTTDVAAAPFLWVIPLALYLLTFVAVFRERPWIPHGVVVWLVPFAVTPLVVSSMSSAKVFWAAAILLNLAVFVVLTLLCHGELYARRPQPARLTEFFLCTSFGGVLGGAFAGLLAPHLFAGNYEYPILIVLALLALPGLAAGERRSVVIEAAFWLSLGAALLLISRFAHIELPASSELPFQAGLILLAGIMLFQRDRPLRFVGLAMLSFTITTCWRPGLAPVEIARSFFGVHKVVETADGRARLLYHGNTLHGAERLRANDGTPVAGLPEALTYYYPFGPFAEAITAARAAHGGFDRVAVIGLGAGALACHRRGGEAWTFFEIDPEVVRIARNPARFEFLSRCAPDAATVLGDARLTLAAATKPFDLIALDAFSSDAIPVHLLTREAFAGYLTKLSPHGVIVAHISNRHLDLAPVLANVAQSLGLVAFLKEDSAAGDFMKEFHTDARIVMLARTPADVGRVASSWTPLAQDSSSALWTDDYSNILGAMLRRKFGG
ncbi:fused MFS/spermidine synthase [Bradyrhizobium sp. NP1]|uniref:fused MFS/spermidine synthase n=1 Tax=Bradyrhizobium sp. NP1 TaxID=3049772 RepID=UPI0025A505D2|nr:fused MFS/spermidine synthase [Bradyrhizobium sp. NP1]WJR79386.1 fused MFS/spermidine synthase [Bradyrhizobium sp. NP1]